MTQCLEPEPGREILLNDTRGNIAGSIWTEYLCLECTPDEVILTSCTYDMLAPAEQYVRGYADGTPLYVLPKEINGETVVGVEDEHVIGGALQDWSGGDNTFVFDPRECDTTDDEADEYQRMRDWLAEREWNRVPEFEEAWKRIVAAIDSVKGKPDHS